jgi:molecular chaperone DnaK (HSP70)
LKAVDTLCICCMAQIAKRQAVVNPENTFFSVKRFIGRKMEEVKDESKQAGAGIRGPFFDML